MKIHQIVYNSSASTLNGSSGFGVRTASEGTPQEYINTVNNTSHLRSYNAGKFNIPANVIMTSPEKIFEFPRSYYYKTLQINDRKVYAIGRIVSTCFDHSFYATGKATRPGNYIAHILMSDEFPGKQAFNLLADRGASSGIKFIPADWTPVQSNEELVELMVGKPQSLPALGYDFSELQMQWSPQSLDLLFSYRAAQKAQKPIVVSLNDAITAPTVAMFMNLLPESLAKETTFIINHQAEGHSKDVRISFINEYYQHTIYPNLCSHINLMDGNRPADKVEEIWRPKLEKALNEGNSQLVELLCKWIFSSMADDNADSSADINEALFNYSQNPTQFTINTIDEIPGILGMLSKYVNVREITTDHLNNLLISMSEESIELADYAKAIGYCERISKEGLNVSPAFNSLKTRFTAYVTGDPVILYDSLKLLKESILTKYTFSEKYPELNDILPVVIKNKNDIDQIVTYSKYLEGNAESRVKIYTYHLNTEPGLIRQYSALLDSDRAEAEKVDYISIFKAHLSNPEFAPLFYQQVKRESNMSMVLELAKKIYDLTEDNQEFTKLIISDDQIYFAIYSTVKRKIKPDNYGDIANDTKKHILSLLLPESKARKQWQLLYNVLTLNKPDIKNGIMPFYTLAKELMHLDALKAIAPMCFEVLEKEHIDEFLNLIYGNKLMTDAEIVECALSKKSLHHLSYILPVAKIYKYDYDKIHELVAKFEKDEKIVKRIIKSNFPELYSKHRKASFAAWIKNLFKKRPKDAGEEKAEIKKEKNKGEKKNGKKEKN